MATYMPLDMAQMLVQLNGQLANINSQLVVINGQLADTNGRLADTNEQLANGFNLVNGRIDVLQASSRNIRIIKHNQARVADSLELLPLLKTVRRSETIFILNSADLPFLGCRSWFSVSNSKPREFERFERSDTRRSSASNWRSTAGLSRSFSRLP
jgi:hypothetical protein